MKYSCSAIITRCCSVSVQLAVAEVSGLSSKWTKHILYFFGAAEAGDLRHEIFAEHACT